MFVVGWRVNRFVGKRACVRSRSQTDSMCAFRMQMSRMVVHPGLRRAACALHFPRVVVIKSIVSLAAAKLTEKHAENPFHFVVRSSSFRSLIDRDLSAARRSSFNHRSQRRRTSRMSGDPIHCIVAAASGDDVREE